MKKLTDYEMVTRITCITSKSKRDSNFDDALHTTRLVVAMLEGAKLIEEGPSVEQQKSWALAVCAMNGLVL